MAEDEAKKNDQGGAAALKSKSLGLGVVIAIAAATLVVGILIGRFAMGAGGAGGSGGSANFEKGSLTEAELDTTVATYTYSGGTKTITARQVLEQNGPLDMSVDSDGNYILPTADAVLVLARNQIIDEEINKRGITASDEEITKYAKENLGTEDLETFASEYGMTTDQLKEVMSSELKQQKLRNELASDVKVGEAPAEPTVPEVATTDADGKELDEEAVAAAEEEAYGKETKEYADYIIKLAGDEWDSAKGTWKSPDGPYASALADYKVTKDGASYDAASMAYSVAYQGYAEEAAKADDAWTAFVNGLLGNAKITINTMTQ